MFILHFTIKPNKLKPPFNPRGDIEKSSVAYEEYKNGNCSNIGHINMNDASF